MKKLIGLLFIISSFFFTLSEAKQYNFNPEQKEEFVFVDSFFFSTGKGGALCKPKGHECDKKHDFKQYVNKRFIFSNSPIIEMKVGYDTIKYREIVLENEEKLLFLTNDQGEVSSGLCKYYSYNDFKKFKDKIGQPLIEKSDLLIKDVYVDNSVITVELNNGIVASLAYIKTLEKLLITISQRNFDFKLSKIITNLSHIKYDKFEDAFLINSYNTGKSPISLGILINSNTVDLVIYVTSLSNKIYPNEFKILIDGKRFLSKKVNFVERYNSVNAVDQYNDIVTPELLKFLNNITTHSDISVRISGDLYYKDYELKSDDIDSTINLLKLYEQIKEISN